MKEFLAKNKVFIGVGIALGLLAITYINRNKLKTVAKTVAKEAFSGQKWFDTSLQWWRDSKTKDIIGKLHPKFQSVAAQFFARVEKELGLRMFATSGYRTFAEQAAQKAANASNASAGTSAHNYGLAVDVNVIDPKTGKNILMKASPKANWEKSGIPALAKSMGMIWGGDDFSGYYDPVHFAIEPNGMKGTQLLALHNAGKVDSNGYVIV